jgi:hypothetical protein
MATPPKLGSEEGQKWPKVGASFMYRRGRYRAKMLQLFLKPASTLGVLVPQPPQEDWVWWLFLIEKQKNKKSKKERTAAKRRLRVQRIPIPVQRVS